MEGGLLGFPIWLCSAHLEEVAPDLLTSPLCGPELRGFSMVLAEAGTSPREQLPWSPSSQRPMRGQSPLHDWGNWGSVKLAPQWLST